MQGLALRNSAEESNNRDEARISVDLATADTAIAKPEQRQGFREKLKSALSKARHQASADPTAQVVERATDLVNRLSESISRPELNEAQRNHLRSMRHGLVCALVAADVYHDKQGQLPQGVRRLDGESFSNTVAGTVDQARLRDPKSGYFAALYYDTFGKTYIYANRGTDGGADWVNNVQQASGLKAEQYKQAIGLAGEIKWAVQILNGSDASVVWVGHSLGGGLATAIAESIGGQAVVFNPAGVHNRTLERNASEQASSSQIFSFVVDGEILTELQKKANGYVAGVRYSVVPEAKEQVIELKPSTKFSINPATEATQRHSMCAVLLGLLELYEK